MQALRTSLVLLLFATLHAVAQTSLDLPDIGDPAAIGLTLPQERRLGPVIVRRMRSQLPMQQDVELNEYLASLGSQLLTAHAQKQLDFHFLLASLPEINAFATPGGVVSINSGLLIACESESELVGVLAHEVTHVKQRHLARLIAQSKRSDWVGYLAAIGTVLAAAYDSRLAQLGTYAVTASAVDRSLSYSRTFEEEADRLGMQLMANAGYAPAGMPQFFSRLQTLAGGDSSRVPEFLRTHPLTARRLAEALDLAARYSGEYRENSEEFLYAKARLEALADPRSVVARPLGAQPTASQRYRRAVALTRTGGAREAVTLLQPSPDGDQPLAVGLALGEAYLAQGDLRLAIKTFEALSQLYPGRGSVAYWFAETLLRVGRPQAALEQLRPFAAESYAPSFKKLMSRAAAADGRQWLSHKHLADYYQAQGRMEAALEQLQLAEKDPRINSLARSLIATERRKIERLQKTMREDI